MFKKIFGFGRGGAPVNQSEQQERTSQQTGKIRFGETSPKTTPPTSLNDNQSTPASFSTVEVNYSERTLALDEIKKELSKYLKTTHILKEDIKSVKDILEKRPKDVTPVTHVNVCNILFRLVEKLMKKEATLKGSKDDIKKQLNDSQLRSYIALYQANLSWLQNEDCGEEKIEHVYRIRCLEVLCEVYKTGATDPTLYSSKNVDPLFLSVLEALSSSIQSLYSAEYRPGYEETRDVTHASIRCCGTFLKIMGKLREKQQSAQTVPTLKTLKKLIDDFNTDPTNYTLIEKKFKVEALKFVLEDIDQRVSPITSS